MKKAILVCVILTFSTSGHAECPTADLSGDCFVGLADLAVLAGQWEGGPNMPLLYDMADQWLTAGQTECPTADRTGDCYVGLADLAILVNEWENKPDMAEFSVMASQWLTGGVPVDPENLLWVYINDSGAGMTDGDGNPVSHGGFTGEMSKYETTNAQYCEYLNAALASYDIRVSGNRVYGNSGDYNNQVYFDTSAYTSYSQITYSGGSFSVRSRDGYSMANHPVVEITWYGAIAFCNYYGYRLPTEWEWQAVADFDGSYTYGCGTILNFTRANYRDGSYYANPLGLTSFPYTSPVNHYSSYGYRMNDMAGNVYEWTSSIYSSGPFLVVRGGAWHEGRSPCTVSRLSGFSPGYTSRAVGFRVCR